MKVNYTNNADVPLSAALWLLDDGYSQGNQTFKGLTFSATELIKPVRQIVLRRQMLESDMSLEKDLISFVASRTGQAVHDSLEQTWIKAIKRAHENKDYALFEKLGIQKMAVDGIVFNPENPKTVNWDEEIPIFTETRLNRQIEDVNITGEFDFCFDGQLEDFKVTKVYSYSTTLNSHHYRIQGSIYNWLDRDNDYIRSNTTQITFILKDWSLDKVGQPNYPPAPIAHKQYELMSLMETQQFIRTKVKEVKKYLNEKDQNKIPECTDEEIGKKPSKFAYKAKEGASRATKVFDSREEAEAHLAGKKGKGVIEERVGSVTMCKYCDCFPKCEQKDAYLLSGALKI